LGVKGLNPSTAWLFDRDDKIMQEKEMTIEDRWVVTWFQKGH